MSQYNYQVLSSLDFEELTRDLLQEEWGVALESFTTGRDGGIDLRFAKGHDGATIVQCKHWAKSGFDKLLSHLRISEKPKIERLQPQRYVVATTVSLTPHKKDQIIEALQPFVTKTADVIGAEDIDGLLARHDKIARSHYKLWLTSVDIMERILHNAEACHTQFEIDRIRDKLPRFVTSKAFSRALELLEENRVLVISGPPGIGKTTLAEMILFQHIEQGYEPVVIQTEIKEGSKFFRPDARRIFYYDDFLGQTFLGDKSYYSGRKEDVALVNFMDMVRKAKDARFILTTREHILKNAFQMSERMNLHPFFERSNRCILQLQDYSNGEKARILYNHLEFSDIEQSYRAALLKDDFFLKIITHENFNPRLVEWLSSAVRLKDVPVERYTNYIEGLFDSPIEIWRHAFRKQISFAAQDILFTFYTLGTFVKVVQIEPPYRELNEYRSTKYGRTREPGAYRRALEELDGGFLSYRHGNADYINPSVKDFVGTEISEDLDSAEDLLNSAIRVRQISNLWDLFTAKHSNTLTKLIQRDPEILNKAMNRALRSPWMHWERRPYEGTVGYSIDTPPNRRLSLIIKIAESLRSTELVSTALEVTEKVASDRSHMAYELGGFVFAFECIRESKWFMKNGGGAVSRLLLDIVLSRLSEARASDWRELINLPEIVSDWCDADQVLFDRGFDGYFKKGVVEESQICTTEDEIEELIGEISDLGEETGRKFGQILENLEIRRLELQEENERDEDWYEDTVHKPKRTMADFMNELKERNLEEQRHMTDDDIRQMFQSLRLE